MLRRLAKALTLVTAVVLLEVLAHAAAIGVGLRPELYGVLPRSDSRWFTIFSAPFVHANSSHLMSNCTGLLVFGSMVALRSRLLFLFGSACIIAISGGLVWLFGREAAHLGASGWVYGLWGMLISIAWLDRKLKSVLMAVVVVFFYGGMVWGLVPSDSRISFEMHLAGVMSGVLVAGLYARLTSACLSNS
ncbi:MAG: rhomboid family intramembrane serine protease [Pseudomonadota bacterium]